jgi:hypothetical protein
LLGTAEIVVGVGWLELAAVGEVVPPAVGTGVIPSISDVDIMGVAVVVNMDEVWIIELVVELLPPGTCTGPVPEGTTKVATIVA